MKQYTYHAEIMTMLEQFTAAFNDIIVKGYDRNKNVIEDSIKKVRFVYAPKQKVYDSLNTPGPGGISVPVVSISVAGLSRDKSRVFNKNQGFNVPYNRDGFPLGVVKNIPQPVPINLTVNMSILTKYQEHMDQIISNFVPYCDPYIVISWKMPGLKESSIPFELRSEVLWDGSIKTSYPGEVQANQPYRISADTSFTIKGWLFKSSEEVVEKIFYINADFSSVNNSPILEKLETETVRISAVPRIKNCDPYHLVLLSGVSGLSTVNNFDIELYGKYFFDITNVYLSASNPSMLSGIQLWDPFGSVPKLSAQNPLFYGIKVPEFTLGSDHYLTFQLPQIPLSAGYIDVIAENEAGYGKLTVGSLRPSISSWSGWVNEQLPCIRGIQVSTVHIENLHALSGLLVSDKGVKIIDEYLNNIIWT